jgi:hypothetical protein
LKDISDCLKQKHEWADYESEYYYHYTSIEAANLILHTKKIRRSVARIWKFGCGVFMTVLEPSKNDYELICNNYRGNTKYSHRVEVAFAIRKSDINDVTEKFTDERTLNRDLWRCNSDIDLENVDFVLINRT